MRNPLVFHTTRGRVHLLSKRYAAAGICALFLTRPFCRGFSSNRHSPKEYRNSLGRNRYSSNGQKKRNNNNKKNRPRTTEVRPPIPPLDSRPTYFTCRHTYEATLREEILQTLAPKFPNVHEQVSFSKPHPGLVVFLTKDEDIALEASKLQPTYALQSLPNCVLVQAESIKALARAVLESKVLVASAENTSSSSSLLLRDELMTAPKGSLAVHALVPEMGRGMPESNLPQYFRATKIAQEVAKELQKRCKAARPHPAPSRKYVLQILLLEPMVVAASFAECSCTERWTWPNWRLPSGLAHVEVEENNLPSSAYRKLLEAFWYMGERPSAMDPVVDLGASPGGWTGALRVMGCKVIAVDRSPLDPGLMKDEGVEFVQGDAFRYAPPWKDDDPSHKWMVSDIIAYPDKILQLLEDWCGRVSHLVVTMKFQSFVDWDSMEEARNLLEKHGYHSRTIHSFNNKNEITILAVQKGMKTRLLFQDDDNHNDDEDEELLLPPQELLGKPMYTSILPKPSQS